uniref:Uncharacterized protein n=1 Tax=Nelumbo nucifera TaxID=4432 RepID=A0A822ZIU5_NELNU|nr:TPA_asm: hypothetical protein HUJ06_004254 [Nelumbo nucifera]
MYKFKVKEAVILSMIKEHLNMLIKKQKEHLNIKFDVLILRLT